MFKEIVICAVLLLSGSQNALTAPEQIDATYWHHYGRSKLDTARLQYEIFSVAQSLPDIRYSLYLSDLVLETMAVETGLGSADYIKADKRSHNYGICQFVLSTAKYVMAHTSKADKPVLMTYYDSSLSLVDNLRTNVRFNIALCLEYYFMRDKNLHAKIKTRPERAKVWKKLYNTSAGVGSAKGYLVTVARYL